MIDVDRRVGFMEAIRMISVEPQEYRKVVVVGDAACGKTAMLQRFSKGHWVGDNYCPTVFEDSSAEVDVGITRVELALWDTSGANATLRLLAYPDKAVVLVCFSLMDAESLTNVEKKWIPEIRHNCPGVPILLVGLQKDAINDEDAVSALHEKGKNPVSNKQAGHVADKIGAEDYVECSARTGKGIDEVFQLVARISLMP